MKTFKKYIMKFGRKVRDIIKKEFNSELVHNEKYLKINAKEGSQCFCTPVILTDSVYRKDKSYYPQVFLEKYDFNHNREITLLKNILMILMILKILMQKLK